MHALSDKRTASASTAASSAAAAPGARLTDAELERLFDERNTPERGRQRIRHIRASLPGRVTRSSSMAGKARLASVKMGFVQEAEAFNTEFVSLVECEYSDTVFEFYSQPDERLKLTYVSGVSGKQTTAHTNPDCFLITSTAFVFRENKTEGWLEEESKRQPNRYERSAESGWRSQPGEAAAAELGCAFELRSDKQNNYILFENVQLLKDFYQSPECGVDRRVKRELLDRLEGKPYVSALDLKTIEPKIKPDDLYRMLVQGDVYFPLHALRLTDQDTALFFRSQSIWEAYEIFVRSDRPERRITPRSADLSLHDNFVWNGVGYEIVNLGQNQVIGKPVAGGSLLTLTGKQFNQIPESDLQVVRKKEDSTPDRSKELLEVASPKDLQEAAWRHEILFGKPGKKNPLTDRSDRTLFYWLSAYREAEEKFGNGFVGLLNDRHGNRQPKVSPDNKEIGLAHIAADFETIRRKGVHLSYGGYRTKAEAAGHQPFSYQTYWTMVRSRAGHKQKESREGEKAAYDLEERFLDCDYKTPRHGTHSWHVGHIDHTPIPLKLIGETFAGLADTLWLTLLHGGHDRKIRAYYLSFDEPSYRSCMMVVRDAIKRHGRIHQIIVVDGGSDFESTYFEQLLALLKVDKRSRPRSKPRGGSTVERVFGTTQSQFIKNLLGATDLLEKKFRSISEVVNPEKQAIWFLSHFDQTFEEYIDLYHSNHHSGIDMSPDRAEAQSAAAHGERPFIRRVYDEQFIAASCPAVRKGVAKVTPQGVKVNYRWFDGAILHLAGMIGTELPARYDPWNGGVAYVFARGKWVQVRSEMYAIFSKVTERQIQFATAAMRLVARKRGEKAVFNSVNLAAFLLGVESDEALARQRRNDIEAQTHRAKLSYLPQQPELDTAAPRPEASGSTVAGAPVPADAIRRTRIVEDL